jgi:arginine exporter protein ArgO
VIADLAAGVLAGLAVAMPIGAIGGYLIGLAARERALTAAAAALGVASVDGAYAVVAAVGGAGVHAALAQASPVLTVLAAVVLVLVATRTLQQAVRRYRATAVATRAAPSGLSPRRAYLTLVAMTAVNPATVITFVAVVLGRQTTDGGVSGSAVALFAVGALVASAAWQLLLVGGGSLLGRLLRGRRGQLGIALCSAGLMLVLAAAVLASL